MNPKGEEGEFYMKKSLLVLASIMILALCTFVACTAEVSDPYDGLTYVTFGGESPTSKNLLASYEVASYDSLYWFYTAEKKDNYGTSGAVANKPVHEGNTGLNNTVGSFSQGKWKFTLSAYKDNAVNENTKVYEGSVEVSLKGQKVTVPVSVTPYGTTGALKFDGAYFEWKASGSEAPVIEIVAKGSKTGQIYTLGNKIADDNTNPEDVKIKLDITSAGDNKTYKIADCEYSTVKADYYNCTIIAYIDDPKTPIFSQTLGFRVYGSATTIIKGDITEQSGTDVNFNPAKQGMAVFKGATTASVEVTPSGTDTTTVDFGANNLDNTSTYYLNVAATSVASAANKFTVSDSTKAPVAGIDLELVKVSSDGSNSKVRKFSGDAVTIKTYIEKGLTGVTVEYNGTDGEDPVVVGYNSDTGELTFTTNHFSEFYAVSDSVAVVSNETEEKGYARLVDAIGSSKDGATIKLLKNIELTESIRIGSIDYRKSLTIDFDGYTISGDSSNDSLFCVENSEVIFTGKGFIVDKCSGYGYGAIEAVGSASSESKNYTVVTVGHEITINDGMAVWINHNSNETKESTSYTSYGVVVNFYGTANRGDIEDFVFYVNGKNKETVNAPVFNIKDATIKSPLSRGIFAAGYAVWNIDNTVIESKKAAIEIRAGELNIVGGTLTATADEFSCKANGNGETTVGAAIAVAQHNTELPINVTISGGTFSGYHALSVVNPQNNDYAAISQINVSVTGGEFTSTKASEGIEAVNYSSEFIKIGDGSVFTIRARKDGDKGNVSVCNGTYYSDIEGAIDGTKGANIKIELLSDIDMTGKGGSEQISFVKDSVLNLGNSKIQGTVSVGYTGNQDPKTEMVLTGDASEGHYNIEASFRMEESGAMMQYAAVDVCKPCTVIESGSYTCNNAVINVQCQGVYDEPTVIMNGGVFDATEGGVCVAQIIGKTEINGGVFSATDGGAVFYLASGDSQQETSITVKGGTFKAVDSESVLIYGASSNGKIIIEGGSFTVSALFGGTVCSVSIRGGAFSVDPTSYLDSGYKAVEENGIWNVVAISD